LPSGVFIASVLERLIGSMILSFVISNEHANPFSIQKDGRPEKWLAILMDYILEGANGN
jgi:hypothetical protein